MIVALSTHDVDLTARQKEEEEEEGTRHTVTRAEGIDRKGACIPVASPPP